MKKTLIGLLSIIIAVSMLFSISGVAVYAFDDQNTRLVYIDGYYGDINQGLLSTKITASVTGSSSVTSVKIRMELQKLSSGDYSTVETWEQTFSGRSGSMEESKLTSPLSTYRLKATVTAYSGSNSESKTFYAYANGFRTSKIEIKKTSDNNRNIVYQTESINDYIWDNGKLIGYLKSNVDENGERIDTQTVIVVYDQEGSPAGLHTTTGVSYMFKKDINENIVSLVKPNGNSAISISYDVWGASRAVAHGSLFEPFFVILDVLLCPTTYHGYLFDYETGMYYNQGRCYSPSWGRYLSPDSLEKLPDRSDNPLDANLYLFCNNNTVNSIDTIASWSRIYKGVELESNGFNIKMNELFASRSICMAVANQIIKKNGSWSPIYGYNFFEMNALRIASDLFSHYIGKVATAAINKVNACWGDGWILNNKRSEVIRVRKNDPNATKYEKIWKAAPEIKAYAQKEGIFITL